MPSVEPTAVRSLAVLLDSLIDYAGLFPPAKLDMPTTVRNYAEYLAGSDSWMLGRLIVPAARLDEFERHAETLLPREEEADAWLLSVLTAPAGDPQLAADLARIAAFNERHEQHEHGLAQIDVIELRADSATAIDQAQVLIPDELFAFFEIPVTGDPRGMIAAMVGTDAAAKVRTGGLAPDAFPTSQQLARFIVTCARAAVPFKATAGMHHPLRHLNAAIGAKEFGFLNVFIAACLTDRCRLDESAIMQVLEAESLEPFTLSDASIRWAGNDLKVDQIEASRDVFALSFGSCSFDEPREDLRKLRLLA